MDNDNTAIAAIICLALGFFAGAVLVDYLSPCLDDIRQEAIEAGAAEYYLDDEHERQFRWLTAQEGNADE